jgi:hypothetical protein
MVDVMRLEDEYFEEGKPHLGKLFEELRETRADQAFESWIAPARLFVLCWYANVEPPRLTGLDADYDYRSEIARAYQALVRCRAPKFVVILLIEHMLEIAPWATGNAELFEKTLDQIRQAPDSQLSFSNREEAAKELEEHGLTRYFHS